MQFLALIGVVAALAGSTGQTAALRAIDRDPLTVRGLRFKPNERVKLLVSASPTGFTRTVRAGARGGFVVRLGISLDACRSAVVQAFGARGTRATLHLDTVDCTSP